MLLKSPVDHDPARVEGFWSCKLKCVISVLAMGGISVVLSLEPLNFHDSVVIRMVSLMDVFAAMWNSLNDVWLFSCISTGKRSLALGHTLATIELLGIIKWLISYIQRLCYKLVSLSAITVILWLKRVLRSTVRSRTSLRHWKIRLRRLNCSKIRRLSLRLSHWLRMNFHNISIEPLWVDKHVLLACPACFKPILVSLHSLSILTLWIASLMGLLNPSLITSWWLMPCLLHLLEIDKSWRWSLVQRLRLLTYSSWCWLWRYLHLLALNSCWLLPICYDLRWFLRLLLCHLIRRACFLL